MTLGSTLTGRAQYILQERHCASWAHRLAGLIARFRTTFIGLDWLCQSCSVNTLQFGTACHVFGGPRRESYDEECQSDTWQITGYEGALRVSFAIRWPGRIEAGRVSDEIVHEMDLFPTLARIAGGKVPKDRVMDGIDVFDHLLGQKDESGREGFVVYMGNDIFGVKWRSFKPPK